MLSFMQLRIRLHHKSRVNIWVWEVDGLVGDRQMALDPSDVLTNLCMQGNAQDQRNG